jgi:antitoxin CcdA
MPDRRELDKEAVPRKPTSIALDAALVAEAQALRIDLSRACEHGISNAMQRAKDERWKAENREALEYANRFVEEHGLPLARFRKF